MSEVYFTFSYTYIHLFLLFKPTQGGRVNTTDTDSNNAVESLAGKGFGVR